MTCMAEAYIPAAKFARLVQIKRGMRLILLGTDIDIRI